MTTPQIDLIYEATTPLGTDLAALMAALQTQVSRDFAPVWGYDCVLSVQPAPRPGVWRINFLDDADQADALGEHELTADGLPLGKVFVKTTLDDGENPCVTASHELLEMLGDPTIDQIETRIVTGRIYAREVCDAVEEATYEINGIAVSNFQTPRWFGHSNPAIGVQGFDFLSQCNRPWQILRGGYMSIQEDGGWTQIFRSVRGASAFRAHGRCRPVVRESGVRRRSTR